MKTLSKIDNDIIKEGSASYRSGIRSSVRALWNGTWDQFEFFDSMVVTIRRYITQAWYDGASKCGVAPQDLTPEEISRLNQEIVEQMSYLDGLANAITQGSKANKGQLTPLFKRAEMWVNKYGMVSSLASEMACRDKKLAWVWNPTKEHCTDCKRLNGRVYRASIWKKYGIVPRMHSLACGGWHCGCRFEVTDLPVTSGRPPKVGI